MDSPMDYQQAYKPHGFKMWLSATIAPGRGAACPVAELRLFDDTSEHTFSDIFSPEEQRILMSTSSRKAPLHVATGTESVVSCQHVHQQHQRRKATSNDQTAVRDGLRTPAERGQRLGTASDTYSRICFPTSTASVDGVPIHGKTHRDERLLGMTDRDKETKHSMLVYDENDSDDQLRTPLRGTLQKNTSTMTQNESSPEFATLTTTVQMMTQLLERQQLMFANMSSIINDESLKGARRSYEGTPLQITTMPDLTSTLPTYSGTDTENLTKWIASLESMREWCSWSDMAMLSAGISRLRGRAAAWHRTEGTAIKEWADWLTALKNEFDKQPLFCQWVTSVNA
ncbi:hypothetical protein HPB47_015071 [Ixodes persulcatus]|uniref:Uncharacterized protein n=1 Tax=Ixodes persulcatus TaxID=34615 RepID=A0AC60R1Z0_IXOPE|nr:hypothetical protein HPB47_015071 [Ixodes persulcatus]